MFLVIAYAYYLVDPANEGRNARVNRRNVRRALVAPRNDARNFEQSVLVLARHRTSSVALTCVVAHFAAGAKRVRRNGELLAQSAAHFADALFIADDWHANFAQPQRCRSSFGLKAEACYCAVAAESRV